MTDALSRFGFSRGSRATRARLSHHSRLVRRRENSLLHGPNARYPTQGRCVRILCFSDLRVQRLADVEAVAKSVEPDLILYAGDDVARFGPGPNSWSPLALSVRHGLAGVIGNDCLEDTRAVLRQPGCRDLQERPYFVGDFAILGLQGAPASTRIGYTLYSDDAAREHLKTQLREAGGRPTIVVSHAPPYGILDLAVRFGLENIGATALLEVMKRPSVKAVVCGHVHLQGGRQAKHGDCLVLNCASHDDPSAALRYAVLEWNGREFTASTHVHDDRGELGDVRGMERRHAEALHRAGIRTCGELHNLGVERLRDLVRGYAPRYWVMAKSIVERRPIFRAPPLPITGHAVFLDVETSFDPADVWMIGFATGAGDVEQLYALGCDRQRRLLAKLNGRMRRLGPSQFLQWSAYDRNALEKAYRRHWRAVPMWLDRARWVDAMWWTDRAFALPFRSRSIKDVSAYFGYAYEEAMLDGMTVGGWYSSYLRFEKSFDVARVLVYNRDDVRALRHVVSSIRALAQNEQPGAAAPEGAQTKAARGPRCLRADQSPLSRREAQAEDATAKYEASTRKQVRAGKLKAHLVSAAVARYRAATRRGHGLPSDAGS